MIGNARESKKRRNKGAEPVPSEASVEDVYPGEWVVLLPFPDGSATVLAVSETAAGARGWLDSFVERVVQGTSAGFGLLTDVQGRVWFSETTQGRIRGPREILVLRAETAFTGLPLQDTVLHKVLQGTARVS